MRKTSRYVKSPDSDMAKFLEEIAQPLCAILNYANACSRAIKTKSVQAKELADPIAEIVSQAEKCEIILKRWKRRR
jgi:hypothetical protein